VRNSTLSTTQSVSESTTAIERLMGEGLLGMAETARLLGTFRGGRPCHASTIVRWCLDGVKLRNGQRLRLEHIRVGERLMTSKAALLRFLEAQQDPASIASTTAPRSPAERARANAKAEAELAEHGI
jgi:hypothetical protein